ncbi:hypothetical protein RR48_07766 [Papilio machaon]|uniref:Uncharacterized protein n=1 Tax=Papilio machaon TaxID=76193 RepID=A0A194R0I7_PAPMA|nr:hypothetical protein RR48_07766 [Papilio machaon]
MEGPGMSLFQGAASIHINNSAQDRLEEQEELEDQKRRNEEIEEHKGIEMQLNSKLAVLQNKLELLGNSCNDELLDNYKQHNEQLKNELDEVRAELKSLDLKYTELEMDYEKLKTEKGSRASIVQEANADLLRELERCSGQLKDTLKENGELKNLYLQIEEHKGIEMQLNSKLAVLQNKLELLGNSCNDELLDNYKQHNEQLKNELDEVRAELKSVCSARDAVSRELKDNQMKIQKEREMYKTQEREYIERIERQKQELVKAANDLTNAREELDRANKRISELQKDFTDKQKEFTEKLNKYLEDEKTAMRKEIPCLQCEKLLKQIKYLEEQLNKCTLKLSTQESSETLMKELKGKAEFFQQYIVERYKRLVDQRCVATNTDSTMTPASPGTLQQKQDSDDDMAVKTSVMMREKAIREQLAEKFTLEMKTMEMNCTRRIQELEAEQTTTLNKLKEMLERKAHEVETLKEFILSERAKVTEILEAKEKEISVLIKEHNELINECQKAKDSCIEWRLKAERYKDRLTKFGSLEDMLKKEREDWKKKTNVCASEWQALKVKVTELQEQLAQQEQSYTKLQTEYQNMQDKYKNAKKTVYTYKEYMAKKDTHINSEINRIQDEYRKIFVKLQNQINYQINCRVQEDRNRGKRTQTNQYPEYDCTEMINKLNEDFSRLAQDNFKDGQSK